MQKYYKMQVHYVEGLEPFVIFSSIFWVWVGWNRPLMVQPWHWPLECTDKFSFLKANYCMDDKRSKGDSNVVEEEMGKHLVSNPFE